MSYLPFCQEQQKMFFLTNTFRKNKKTLIFESHGKNSKISYIFCIKTNKRVSSSFFFISKNQNNHSQIFYLHLINNIAEI